MGETYIRVRVRAPPTDPTCEELDLLVDTGAAYTWISGELLKKLGVKPTRRDRFRTINGDVILRDVGHVFVEYKGEMAPTATVFAGRTTRVCSVSMHSKALASRWTPQQCK